MINFCQSCHMTYESYHLCPNRYIDNQQHQGQARCECHACAQSRLSQFERAMQNTGLDEKDYGRLVRVESQLSEILKRLASIEDRNNESN